MVFVRRLDGSTIRLWGGDVEINGNNIDFADPETRVFCEGTRDGEVDGIPLFKEFRREP